MRVHLVEATSWSTHLAPPPHGLYWLARPDGTRLRVARWEPASPVRGTTLILHGRAEFIEKYVEVIGELQQRGWRVLMADLRGHGHSTRPLADPLKGHADSFDPWVQDIRALIEVARQAGWGPDWALAHSMGGHLLLRMLLLQGTAGLRAAGLISPMLALEMGPLPETLALLIARAACMVGLAQAYGPGQGADKRSGHAFIGNRLTTDAGRFARNEALLRDDPALALGGVTYGWLRAALLSIQAVRQADTSRLNIPLHIASTANDRIVRPQAHRAAAARLPGCSISQHSGEHELLMERDSTRAEIWAALDALIARAGL